MKNGRSLSRSFFYCRGYSLELEGGDPKRIYMKENYDTYLEGGDPKRKSLGIPPLGLLTIYYEKRRISPYAMLGSRGGRVYAPDPNHKRGLGRSADGNGRQMPV